MSAHRQGEELEDFERLFRKHFKRLCVKVYQYTHDPQVAEDLVQDVFTNLWAQRKTLQATQSPEAYLYRSTLNHTLNYLKTTKRHQTYSLDNAQSVGLVSNSVEESVLATELEERIQRAIADLPAGCRQVFLLNRYEDMSYQQIATFLGLSINSVEKHMGRALRLLRQYLALVALALLGQ